MYLLSGLLIISLSLPASDCNSTFSKIGTRVNSGTNNSINTSVIKWEEADDAGSDWMDASFFHLLVNSC